MATPHSSPNTLINLIEAPLAKAQPDAVSLVYPVQPGDTLSHILIDYHDISLHHPDYQLALTSFKHFNPQIKDIHKIYPGQLLNLVELPKAANHSAHEQALMCEINPQELNAYLDQNSSSDQASDQALVDPYVRQLLNKNYSVEYQHRMPSHPAEQEALARLSWLHENKSWLTIPAGIGINTLGTVTGIQNQLFIREIEQLVMQRKAGKLTKGQYDYRRKKTLQKLAQQLGPFEKALFNGKTAKQSIRQVRRRGIPATQKINAELHRLNKLSKLASKGGVILGAAGAAMACHEIANTQDVVKKNEILVETSTSLLVGSASTIAIGILVATTPVGWALALTLAAGSAAASYGSGLTLKNLYNKYGQKYDLTQTTGINRLCR